MNNPDRGEIYRAMTRMPNFAISDFLNLLRNNMDCWEFEDFAYASVGYLSYQEKISLKETTCTARSGWGKGHE